MQIYRTLTQKDFVKVIHGFCDKQSWMILAQQPLKSFCYHPGEQQVAESVFIDYWTAVCLSPTPLLQAALHRNRRGIR